MPGLECRMRRSKPLLVLIALLVIAAVVFACRRNGSGAIEVTAEPVQARAGVPLHA